MVMIADKFSKKLQEKEISITDDEVKIFLKDVHLKSVLQI